MIYRRFILVVILLFVFSSAQAGPLDRDLQISLEIKQVENLSSESLNYVFYLNVKNLSSNSYFLTRYRYRFIVAEQEYLQLLTAPSGGLEISPSTTTMIAIPIKITYDHLFRAVDGVEDLDEVSCYLMGELFFGDGRRERGSLPIAYPGLFPIFRSPLAELKTLQANTVSIGGADLNVSAKFINRNGFDLRVSDIRYTLKLGGHTVKEGRIPGDKNVGKKSEREFQLHLLLNFFEVGKDVYAVLLKDEVRVSFSGEIEYFTDWGRITTPFNLTEDIVMIKWP